MTLVPGALAAALLTGEAELAAAVAVALWLVAAALDAAGDAGELAKATDEVGAALPLAVVAVVMAGAEVVAEAVELPVTVAVPPQLASATVPKVASPLPPNRRRQVRREYRRRMSLPPVVMSKFDAGQHLLKRCVTDKAHQRCCQSQRIRG